MRQLWQKLRQVNQSVWKDVLGPTLVLGFLWLIVSTSTTIFIAWQDRIYDELLVDNVAQLRTVSELQCKIWALQASLQRRFLMDLTVSDLPQAKVNDQAGDQSRGHFQSDVTIAKQELEEQLAKWQQIAGDRHAAEFVRVADDCRHLEELIPSSSETSLRTQQDILNTAEQLDSRLSELMEVHSDEVSQRNAQFQSWTRVVLASRQVFNLLGPVLGVYLGYRAASRLRKQISSITLRLGVEEVNLGAVELRQQPLVDPADLTSLDYQVSRIEERMKSTLKQLEQAQQEVVRSERLAAVGQLAAGVAHEIRNPLTTVKLLVQTGYVGDCQSTPRISEREQQQRLIIDEIDRMERTIQSLLEFARPARPRRSQHDLRETLQRVTNLVSARATQQGVQVSLDLGPTPLTLTADREQLLQVFVNLFLNGIEAMPHGGRLAVKATAKTAAGESGEVVVTVSDQGPGIPPEILPHLFEPFVTSKERGTGLGLAVSLRIVQEHQGAISVDRGPVGGARFTVSLPAQEITSPVYAGSSSQE